ncbi:GNAT family N-acetyltransferase [Microbulbifer mangrovi]|uniref:GNAT family N-acetyltransferase n=1 Tax=Microbulbifer mangrovi TaxID=927787 RepID=UPI00099052F6|nr:GNAT family N-acetyltransferase [Microbulbifer mangrovi]
MAKLVPFKAEFLPELISWIDSEAACHQWGGPWFQYPFDARSFSRDCRWRELPTFVVEDNRGQLLAFGQYYNRLDCCHLGRLIVSPGFRGAGIGTLLITQLIAHGCEALQSDRCSLFVLKDNHRALALYEKLGFCKRDYPEPEQGMEICHYLVAEAAQILGKES